MSSSHATASSLRIFAVSGTVSLLALAVVAIYFGMNAALITLVLMLIEITFSFENAIINARVLMTMSRFWQRMFMTIGIVIAVFGMRIVFPIAIVVLTADLSWSGVIQLALQHPEQYAEELDKAHPMIAAFGGMFLVMLCLNFFFDQERTVRWITFIERPLQRYGTQWLYVLVSAVVLSIITLLPMNDHPKDTLVAGAIGMTTYLAIHIISALFTTYHNKAETAQGRTIEKAGAAGLMAFLYLEVLDASFSFDGVIGAFAVTQDVILIAIGLGVGALWVRSLTLFMVRKKVLHAYRYLEHGAHYTIGVLAAVLLIGLFRDIPEAVAGVCGVVIVGLSVASSVRARRSDERL